MQYLARGLHVLNRHAALRCTLFLLLAWLAALEALAQARGMNTFHDAQFLAAYERHARLSVLGYGELPFWDPFSCGGLYGLAAPQARYASPLFLLSLWLGVERAASLCAVLLPALGMEGMYRYARSWNARASLALACAPIFPLSGFFAAGWRLGWVHFLSFAGLPWVLLGLRRALRGSRAGALLCALSCALIIGFGSSWTLPMGVVLAVFELLDTALPRLGTKAARRLFWGRLPTRARLATARVATAGLLVAGAAAFRLWPMLESAEATLRVMAGEPTTSLETLLRLLFEVAPPKEASSGLFYVTPLVLLSLLALPLGRARLMFGSAGFILLLSLGHVAPFAPFALLRALPVYETIRYPERCLVLFALAAALLLPVSGSAALAWLRKRRGRQRARRWELGLCALCLLGLAPQLDNGWQLTGDVQLAPAPEPRLAPFRQSRGNRWLMSHFAAEGLGSLACGEAYPLPMSMHLRGDLEAEEYLLDPVRGQAAPRLGRARREHWSPQRIGVRVEAHQVVRLAINQNYHPGWHSSVGRVESWDGLLSVVLPPGTHQVVLRFRPRSGIGGLSVSLLSLLAAALYAFAAPRRPWQRALLVSSGPAALALLLAAWPEPRWRHPAPRTPEGAPVVLDALPADAKPWNIRFDVPLVLSGSRVPDRDLGWGTQEITLDLFFRREGPLSPTLGLFVHIHGPEGPRIQADHPEISGQLYLPGIPLGQIAHDRFRVALPDDAPRGVYRVEVGLWNAHGDGARRQIVDAGGAPQHENAITIGSFTMLRGTP